MTLCSDTLITKTGEEMILFCGHMTWNTEIMFCILPCRWLNRIIDEVNNIFDGRIHQYFGKQKPQILFCVGKWDSQYKPLIWIVQIKNYILICIRSVCCCYNSILRNLCFQIFVLTSRKVIWRDVFLRVYSTIRKQYQILHAEEM